MASPCIKIMMMFFVVGLAACAQEPPAPASPTVRLVPGPKGDLTLATFDVIGLATADLARLSKDPRDADGWNALFSVGVDQAATLDDQARPTMPGTHAVVGAVLRFTPRDPLVPGSRYRAVLDPSRLPAGSRGTGSGPIRVILSLSEAEEASGK
jgi:hypothetical protein